MAENVVSPTPVFMGSISDGPRNWPTGVSVATDTHLALQLQIAELRHGAVAAAATLADFRVATAEKFAATERRALEGQIAAMRAANSDGLLKAIASKVGASA